MPLVFSQGAFFIYTFMKHLILITVSFLISVSVISCSSTNSLNAGQWKYFGINASTDDDVLFVKLQDEMNIEPKMQSYLITIDLRDKDENNHKLIVGELTDITHIIVSWKSLSKETRNGLIRWDGSNKFRL